MGDSAYSFSLTTFSPSGKLVQIEYALNAVATGSTSLGVKAKNGVVVATEKKLPTCANYRGQGYQGWGRSGDAVGACKLGQSARANTGTSRARGVLSGA